MTIDKQFSGGAFATFAEVQAKYSDAIQIKGNGVNKDTKPVSFDAVKKKLLNDADCHVILLQVQEDPNTKAFTYLLWYSETEDKEYRKIFKPTKAATA